MTDKEKRKISLNDAIFGRTASAPTVANARGGPLEGMDPETGWELFNSILNIFNLIAIFLRDYIRPPKGEEQTSAIVEQPLDVNKLGPAGKPAANGTEEGSKRLERAVSNFETECHSFIPWLIII